LSEILGYLIGGIGVFFVGMHLLTLGLKQITGRRLQVLLAKWTGDDFRGGLVGCLIGAVTQSMSGLSFVLASLISVGMITVRQTVPVMCWANAGVGILILIAFLNIQVAILFVLGIAGISYAFEKPLKYRHLAQALLGMGLLFYGLFMIRTGAAPLGETEWFKYILTQCRNSYFLGFLIGAVLTAISQTSSAVTILAIAMTHAGQFSVEETIMIIYGANFGSSISTGILATSLKGTPRQLVMAQVLFNGVAAAILLPLFYLETQAGIPLIKALVFQLSDRFEQQMGWVFILYNLAGAIALSFCFGPYTRMLAYFWPATTEEEWSKVKYLNEQALKEPLTAVALLNQEQIRLFTQLPKYMDEIRTADQSANKPALRPLNEAFFSVSKEIEMFASELLSHCDRAPDIAEQVIHLKKRQDLITALNGVVFDLASALEKWSSTPAGRPFRNTFLECLDTILLMACDAMESRTAEDCETLKRLTSDRGDMMQKMRRTYLSREESMTSKDRLAFLEVTGLFERAVWILARIAQTLTNHGETQ